jgi:hypothetical protein
LDGSDVAGLSHPELEIEERLDRDGRELLRRLFDDHLGLRAVRERRRERAVGSNGVARGRVEAGHSRALETVFGTVTVERMAYRAPGVANLHPADAALNLPVERRSHGLRRLAAIEAARGSFTDTVCALERATGQQLGRRQLQELAQLAVDFEDFYDTRRAPKARKGDLLVLSADGKGITMRPTALRTANRAPRAGPWPDARLAGGERPYRKRMAEIGAVYDATPAPPAVADILPADRDSKSAPGPLARNKWLCASVLEDPAKVIARDFGEAKRRDPKHRRTWLALVDGANYQIQQIRLEARKRKVTVTIIIDFIHVIESLASRQLLPRRRHPHRAPMGAPPSDQGAPGTRPQGRRHDPPHRHQHKTGPHPPPTR